MRRIVADFASKIGEIIKGCQFGSSSTSITTTTIGDGSGGDV